MHFLSKGSHLTEYTQVSRGESNYRQFMTASIMIVSLQSYSKLKLMWIFSMWIFHVNHRFHTADVV